MTKTPKTMAQRLARSRAAAPTCQMPGGKEPPTPPPVYVSWRDYLARTPPGEVRKRCALIAKRMNRKRLLSQPAQLRGTAEAVWSVMCAARGRCAHCGSLAVERRPSDPANGAPVAWAQIGRRIGSLEHKRMRFEGGDNDAANLAWCCLWCNTWPNERRPGATDHGGLYPDLDIQPDPKTSEVDLAIKEHAKRALPVWLDDYDDDSEMFPDHEYPEATAMWRDCFG